MSTPTTVAALRSGAGGASDLLASLLQGPHVSHFEPEAYHAMQQRDNQLIRDEILHGVSSKKYVYNFNLSGTQVTGISTVGASELASQYKGIKSRIVGSVEKRGALFIFRSFDPLSIETRHLPDLEAEVDFYECVMEVTDLKTGNSVQVRKTEDRLEKKRNSNEYFVRQHYDTIAESKARRNGILAVLPQSVIEEFKQKCLREGSSSNEATIEQRRAAAAAHAAKHGIALDRQVLTTLTFDELTGLGGAAAQGIDAFKRSAIALGLVSGVDGGTGEIVAGPTASPTPAPPAASAAPRPTSATPADGNWEPTPEEKARIQQQEEAEAEAQRQSASGTKPAAPAATPAPVTPGRRTRNVAAPE